MSETTVQITCYNCSHRWEKELRNGERIGSLGRLGGGLRQTADDVVCIKRVSFAPRKVECPVCGMEGPHDIRSAENVIGQ